LTNPKLMLPFQIVRGIQIVIRMATL